MPLNRKDDTMVHLREIIKWGWRNDRAALLIPVIVIAFMIGMTLTLEIIS